MLCQRIWQPHETPQQISQTFQLTRYTPRVLKASLGGLFSLKEALKGSQGYNCGNLPAENQREKRGRKALCLGYCPVWTGPVDQGGHFNMQRTAVLDSDLDSPMFGLPGSSWTAHFPFSKCKHAAYSSRSRMTSPLAELKMHWTDEYVWMWNLDLWEHWIGGVERRGKEAQHMASFSEVKWRFEPIRYSLMDVVNITLHCIAFGCCYNNTRCDTTQHCFHRGTRYEIGLE